MLNGTVDRAQAALSMLKQSTKSTNLEKKMGPKSVFNRPAHVPRPVAISCPRVGSSYVRTVSATLTSISDRNTYKGSGRTQKLKPKVTESDIVVSKPLSEQICHGNKGKTITFESYNYIVIFAEWQGSKGKILKRPTMKIAQTKLFETKKAKSHREPDTVQSKRLFGGSGVTCWSCLDATQPVSC